MAPQVFVRPAFDGMGWASMRIAAEDELSVLAEGVAVELPVLVERVKRIGRKAAA